ncbi:MAG: hypothetical protein ACOCUI_03615 [bacterium]
MSKSVIINNLKEDLRRINENIKMYKKKIEKYPQGYLREKKINGKSYYYLRKRYGDKYVKKEDVEEVKVGIKKRRFIEENLKGLIEQKKYIEKNP